MKIQIILFQVNVCWSPEDDAEVHHYILVGSLKATLQVNGQNLNWLDIWICIHQISRKDNVRALLILLQNPIFSAQSTYTVFAHVLQESEDNLNLTFIFLLFSSTKELKYIFLLLSSSHDAECDKPE